MKPRIHLSPTTPVPATGGDPTAPDAIVRVVLEKSPLLVYIVNLDFKVVLANRSLREVTGYDTSDCPNVDALIDQFYPYDVDFKQRVRDIHEGWRRNEHVMGAKLLVQCKNGAQRTIAWYTSRLRVGRGPTVGYVAMGLDLTTQGTLEQWVDLLQRTLQHLTEGVILTDATGSVLAWNEGATRLLGYQESGMQGKPLDLLFPPTQRAALNEEINDAIEGPDARFADDLTLVRKSGGNRELSFAQVRLDGEGGAPLARLTVLALPESEGDDLIARAAGLEAKLQEAVGSKQTLQSLHDQLATRVSTMDAELATQGAAAGQIADLRGQLQEALNAAEKASKRVEELEAAAAATESIAAIAPLDEIEIDLEDDEPVTDAALQLDESAANKEALGAARAEADAATRDAEAAKAELETAKAGREAAKADLETAKADLATAKAEMETAKAEMETAKAELATAKAELEVSTAEGTGSRTELQAAAAEVESLRTNMANSEQALEDQKESWVLERSKLQDEHRSLVDGLNTKASEQRRSLETQLHKDILAAEERAEMEHQKLIDRFASEKKDMAQAAEIAHAEIESRSAQVVSDLRRQLSESPDLQSHLFPVSAAVVSADTSGTVIGWSSGAEALEGTVASNALGKVIFEDVLALRGLKWKSLFGQVVVTGAVEKAVSLHRVDGSVRDVTLRARLVRNESGAPLGVTAEVVELSVKPHAAAREDAAVLRLLAPFRAQLAAQTAQAYRAMQATVARVQQIERLGQPDADFSLDGLVAQVASATSGKTVCELGSEHQVGDRGRAVASLLFALVESQADTVVSTVGDPPLVVRGGSWSREARNEASWLAAEGSLGLSFADGEARVQLILPPEAEGARVESPANETGSPVDEVEATLLVDLDAVDLELDEPEGGLEMAGADDGEIELDAEDENRDLVRSGRVDIVGGEDGELEVYAGEDSIIKSADAIYMNVSSLAEVDPVLRTSEAILARKGEGSPASGKLPPIDEIDEIDEISSPSGEVSPALLNTTGAMDAYVAETTAADDELIDGSAVIAGPSQAVLKEMQSTDDNGDSLSKAAEGGPDANPDPVKAAPKKRRRSRKRKS